MPRDYRAEYERRVRRTRGRQVPRTVARGHGTVPAGIARRAEAGELTEEERARFGPGLAAYEQRYGPTRAHQGYRGDILPRVFVTREQAEAFTREYLNIPDGYFRIIHRGGAYRIQRLR